MTKVRAVHATTIESIVSGRLRNASRFKTTDGPSTIMYPMKSKSSRVVAWFESNSGAHRMLAIKARLMTF